MRVLLGVMEINGSYEPRSIILDVVFLDFLDVMIGLWIVHAFGTGHVRHFSISYCV